MSDLSVKRNRRGVPAAWITAAYGLLLVAEIALLLFVRGHSNDWFAGGNAAGQAVADAQPIQLALLFASQALLVAFAMRLSSRQNRLWALLPLPFVLWATTTLAVAATGPGAGAA